MSPVPRTTEVRRAEIQIGATPRNRTAPYAWASATTSAGAPVATRSAWPKPAYSTPKTRLARPAMARACQMKALAAAPSPRPRARATELETAPPRAPLASICISIRAGSIRAMAARGTRPSRAMKPVSAMETPAWTRKASALGPAIRTIRRRGGSTRSGEATGAEVMTGLFGHGGGRPPGDARHRRQCAPGSSPGRGARPRDPRPGAPDPPR